MTLQDAVDSLYRIAVMEGKAASSKRLDGLARFCVAELASRGLRDAVTEATLPGGGRETRITRLSGRRPPSWSIGMIEASLFLEVDFSEGPRLVSGAADAGPFFDRLVAAVRNRNPVLERSP